MKIVVLAPEAEKAIEEIALYSLERWGESKARQYVERLREAHQRLAENPSLGRLRRRIGRIELREVQVGRHILFYASGTAQVLVVAVLHDAMDLPRRRDALLRRLRARKLI